MSHSKDGQTPRSRSTSPEQYQYGNYLTPNHTSNHHFYPPQLPALPGPAYPPGLHHHHGFHPAHGNLSPGGSFLRGNAPPLQDGNHLGPYATPNAPLDPHQKYYGSELFQQIMSANALKSSPYYSPPQPMPPLPGAELGAEVSPNDLAGKESSKRYHDSPYLSEAPALDAGSGSSESSASTTTMTNRPVPARSAFMCFSEAKGKEICRKKGAGSKGGFVESVAAEWRSLSKQDKAYWERMAKGEKTRFAKEKEAHCRAHKGPVARKLRAKKHPSAPKRPMSAFLMYAQQKRRPLQLENPDMPNADISRLLGEIWRNTSMAEKRPFLEREEVERKIYKAKMEAWKNNQKLEKSMKSSTVASFTAKTDQRQDATSFAREESHSHRYDPTESSVASPTSAPAHTHMMYHESHAYSGPYYEYAYDTSNWAPMPGEADDASHIKYTYPRPPGDH